MSIKARVRTPGAPRELSINASLTISCRRDLQTAPSRCKNPSVCGDFCTNAAATEWKVFERDGESQIAAEERRVERGHVIQQILLLLKRHFKIYLLATASATRRPLTTQAPQASIGSSLSVSFLGCSCIKLLVHVAKHIELLIYRAAFSRLEYANTATLLRRVQHFAAILSSDPRWKVKIVAKQVQTPAASSCSPWSLAEMKKRLWFFSSTRWRKCSTQMPKPMRNPGGAPVSDGVLINANEQCYRSIIALTETRRFHPRRSVSIESATLLAAHRLEGSQLLIPRHPSKLVRLSSSPFAALFEGHHAPLLTQIFGFLDGVSVVRLFALSRYCYAALPQAITNLRVSTSGLAKFLNRVTRSNSSHLTSILPNLQSLCVMPENSSSNRSAAQTIVTGAKKRKRDATPSVSTAALTSELTHSTARFTIGESAIVQLADVLRKNGCPHLRKLSLSTTFINSVSRNAISHLTSALQTGFCPELEYMWLSGNALGDYGAMCVSRLLASNACPKLSLLDLRSNGVGHNGVRYLAAAISSLYAKCQLKQLCLGNNLITEGVLMELLPCFRSGAMMNLNFLGLDRNFLTRDCVDMLARQVVSGNLPSLRELCVGGNVGLTEEQISSAFRDVGDSTEGASWGLFHATTSVAPSFSLRATPLSSEASESSRPSKRVRAE